jgi:hypothetical protein
MPKKPAKKPGFEKHLRQDDFRYLMACQRTLSAMGYMGPLCPKCQEYTTVTGFVCFGCGHDRTQSDKEVGHG